MDFREFARNYLNPFFMIWRMILLTIGFACLTAVSEEMNLIFNIIVGGIGLWFCYKAVIPWGGRGLSINDISKKIDDVKNWNGFKK